MSTAPVIQVEEYPLTVAAHRRAAMAELLERDPESWCRLRGLQAMLDLPATKEQRQTIEIEIDGNDDEWMAIDSVDIRLDAIRYTKGHNGHSNTHVVPLTEPVLRWRVGPRELTPRYV